MSLNVPWYIGFLLKILRNYLTSAICKNGMSLVVFCGGSSHGQHSYPSSFFPSSNGKSRGVLHPRVQQVGPEHFGIICFDCHKVSSKFLLADFYGRCSSLPRWSFIRAPPSTLPSLRSDRPSSSTSSVTAWLPSNAPAATTGSCNAPLPPPVSRPASFIPSSPSSTVSRSIP